MKITIRRLKGLIKEVFGNEPYDLNDRSGRDDLPTQEASPEAVAHAVKNVVSQFHGDISNPESGNELSERELVQFCIEMMTGTGEMDIPGARYQIQQYLNDFDVAPAAAEALSQELYQLVSVE